MSKARTHRDIQAMVLIDLIQIDCAQMKRRLDMLEGYFDARLGNFDIQRAFIREIDQRMTELRQPIATRVSARERVSA